jgi:hypothetical protein
LVAERETYLKSRLENCVIIYEWECEWRKKKVNLNFKPKISPLLTVDSLHVDKMISLINDDKIYGFALVDLRPTEKADFFNSINWSPIYKKMQVEFNMLPSWMKVKMNAKTFPRTTLVQSMQGDKLLLHTKLLQFYIRNGFIISKLHRVFEYQGAPALSHVYSNVYEARVAATETSDETKSTAIKESFIINI